MLETTTQIILQELLYVLLIALVPFISKYLIVFLEASKNKVAEQVKNDKVEATVLKVLGIVENAVESTNQTFVSELKKNGGRLTEKTKKEAYEKTYDTVKAMLTNDVIDLIVEEYGDLDVYLDTLIEKVVANKK